MKIINFIKMNNWGIKKFLILVISFQLSFWGIIGLDLIGLNIPILRQLVCFIYLTFIPGFLTLRIFKLHKLDAIENLLYAVGLSISILMFTGLFMNTVYPKIGILYPISIMPLIFTISSIVLIQCILCYIIDGDFEESDLTFKYISSTPVLFLCLIPLLTIIGTYLVNFYNNNLLLIVVIFLISLIVFFVSVSSFSSSLYPLAIFVTAISLLFHNSLISTNLFGWDIQVEYYMANNVITNSLWNSSLYSNVNSMLSIVMLTPIYSLLLNLSLTWVFKIVYPFIFSLLTLGLYVIFQKQTNDKIAFISTFFFMYFFVFYSEMLQLARQQIAEYFLVLVILLIFQNKHTSSSRTLFIIFGFSLIVSHYGLSYLVMGSFIVSLPIFYAYSKYINPSSNTNAITSSSTLLFSIFLISWYLYNSDSSALNSFVNVINSITQNIASDFLNPDRAQGLYVLSQSLNSPLHRFTKFMHIFTQIFISIGLFYIIINELKGKSENYSKFSNEYLTLCIVFYIILIAAIAVPNFAVFLNTSRIYHISLIFLAPFCVIGGLLLINELFERVSLLKMKKKDLTVMKVLCIFLSLFLLFNSGWIYEIAKDSPTSFSLSKDVDYPLFNEQETEGKEWLYRVNEIEEHNGKIYADYYRIYLFRNSFNKDLIAFFPKDMSKISSNSFIYLGTVNIMNNIGIDKTKKYFDFDLHNKRFNKVYDNKFAQIYNI